MDVKVSGRRPAVHPNQLKRQNPANGRRLDQLQRQLRVTTGTEAIAEAIAIALLITDKGRRTFFVEETPGGKLIRIEI